MTSSRLEPPTYTTGAHRAQGSAPRSGSRTLAQSPPARYEPYLDGLFTYCLSVLCDHETATAVLGDVLAIAERQYGRSPAEEPRRKAWLYALARWACLRALTEQRRRRQGAHAGRQAAHASGRPPSGRRPYGRTQTRPPARPPATEEAPRAGEETTDERRRELALLAWPEAAGTTPEQREALELAVRHQLGAPEVAAVLGMAPQTARELLSTAACEVERTRAALAVVETGTCSAVARLTGDHQVLLSAALRRELVRHVDDCPLCRRVAERAEAAGPWPGSTVTPATLPLVEAPRSAAYVAMVHAPRARSAGPRFGRDGFPLDPKDHAARRDRMRARAVTTTVVATVIAAPVLALWAAYRGDQAAGDGRGDPAVTAADETGSEAAGRQGRQHYENTGNTRTGGPDPRFRTPSQAPDVTVEVITPGTPLPSTSSGQPGGPGRITVAAQPHGDTTMLKLTASGGGPVAWSLWTDAPWLYASRTSGRLEPGRSETVYITVDHDRQPRGAWSARVGVNPSGAVIGIEGNGPKRPPAQQPPTHTGRPTPDPRPQPSSPPGTASPAPRPTPPPSSTSPGPGTGTDPGTPPPSSEPPSSTPPPSSSAPPPADDPPPEPAPPPPNEPAGSPAPTG
ncbi:sigma-70 family RNA polymerase sigma factor [Streptomyces sp. TRM64462]|uniref:sigma-70 family RNA polymerase sigma factor n=1 Tax=Streptomyces sp. TRM64462 TaxID=2741726 RepID=UPI001586A2FA|nr:sigma-70 family RNA polymerase sigma factor [Streptomyces sp. TRM64462]